MLLCLHTSADNWWTWNNTRERVIEEDVLGELIEWKGPVHGTEELDYFIGQSLSKVC